MECQSTDVERREIELEVHCTSSSALAALCARASQMIFGCSSISMEFDTNFWFFRCVGATTHTQTHTLTHTHTHTQTHTHTYTQIYAYIYIRLMIVKLCLSLSLSLSFALALFRSRSLSLSLSFSLSLSPKLTHANTQNRPLTMVNEMSKRRTASCSSSSCECARTFLRFATNVCRHFVHDP